MKMIIASTWGNYLMTQCHIIYQVPYNSIWNIIAWKKWCPVKHPILRTSCCITYRHIIVFHFLAPWLSSDVWFSVGFLMWMTPKHVNTCLSWMSKKAHAWLAVEVGCWLGAQLRPAARAFNPHISSPCGLRFLQCGGGWVTRGSAPIVSITEGPAKSNKP